MERTDSIKTRLIETAKALQGSARRLFMARTVQALGSGGQQRAARALGGGRMTIRKGMRALDSGLVCLDAFTRQGRKRAAAHLPNLLTDMHALVDRQSPTAPPCRTHRWYTRLTAAAVRRQLIPHKGYPDAALPTAETMGATLHILGYSPQKVAKSRPQKSPCHGGPLRPESRGHAGGRHRPARRYGSRWTRKRRSQWDPAPVAESVASPRSPWTPIVSRRP